MKIKVAILFVGAAAAQALILGSGCQPEVLGTRGYVSPSQEAEKPYEYRRSGQQPDQSQLADQQAPAPVAATPGTVETIDYQPEATYNTQPAAAAPVYKAEPREELPQEYVVKKGDTLGHIGQRVGVSAAALAKYNNIDAKKYLRIGQVIKIPPAGTYIQVDRPKATTAKSTGGKSTKVGSTAAPAATVAATSGGYALTNGYYLVRKNDSVSKIAANFKVKRADLMKANNLNENSILQIGQKMVIPGKSAAGTAAPVAAKPTGLKPVAPTKTIAPVNVAPTPTPTPAPVPAGGNIEGILDDVEDPVSAAPATPAPATPAPAATAQPAASAPAASAAPAGTTNKIAIQAPTDTSLEQIATQYGTSAEELEKLNPDLRRGQTIKAGRLIYIP